MIKLYHVPLSANSRRVWIALLEKGIAFEQVLLKLDGDQLQPEFLAINPFHHIPVLEDDGFIVFESLAILDYLEAKYPTPPLLPTEPKAIATVKMVEMVTVNELLPATIPLSAQAMGLANINLQKLEAANQKIVTVLKFFESLLNDYPYLGSNTLTLADIVAGTLVPHLPFMGFPIDDYPKLNIWIEFLMSRDAWLKTQPTTEEIQAFLPQAKAFIQDLI
ncbi:MAG: glutathione S-transferase family protein [Coleofasciculaceae cyanobacterium]